MKPFHEIENIPYEEFLNIIQKYTGLTSWRAKISRAGFGVIPSREFPKMLSSTKKMTPPSSKEGGKNLRK